MRLVILEPGKGFLTMTREECHHYVEELIELCIKKLCLEFSPSLLTIKMQSYFNQSFVSRGIALFALVSSFSTYSRNSLIYQVWEISVIK